jgi:hypothetical protein
MRSDAGFSFLFRQFWRIGASAVFSKMGRFSMSNWHHYWHQILNLDGGDQRDTSSSCDKSKADLDGPIYLGQRRRPNRPEPFKQASLVDGAYLIKAYH